MKKELNGLDLAEFVKERQAKAVRGLVQALEIQPKLAIVRTNPEPIVDSYMRIKQAYGDDIGARVEVHTVDQKEAKKLINSLNKDESIHGIIVQIPLPDKSQTDEILNMVNPDKDVDGLSQTSVFDAPTPVAISWLLAGYAVDLRGKNIVIMGNGRLVGAPLAKMWRNSGLEVTVIDKSTESMAEFTSKADILITATGVPGLITLAMVKPDAVIIDAGVSTDSNGLIGDVSSDVRDLPGVVITPIKGGVGPLTVAALFENLITSARKSHNPN